LAKLGIILFALLAACAGALSAEDAPAIDTLRTVSGEFLRGKLLKLENGNILFQATDAGQVTVPVSRVVELNLGAPREARVRLSVDVRHQERVTLSTRKGKVILNDSGGERELALSDLRGIDEALPAGDANWSINGRAFASYLEGNVKNFSLGFRFDVARTTFEHEIKFFSEGNFLQDRLLKEDQVRRRDFAAGTSYRYNAPFRLSCDITEDYYINQFAGFHYRSITGSGLTYFPVRSPDLTYSLSAAGTYVVEDLLNKAEDRKYFGARGRSEFDGWAEARTVHFRAFAEVLFDFEEAKNITATFEALFEVKIFTYFTLGISLRDVFDNLPPPGRFHHDLIVTAFLGVAFGGKGP
jgi:hypothetical protein